MRITYIPVTLGLIVFLGCAQEDLNKDLKPIDANSAPPVPVSVSSPNDGGNTPNGESTPQARPPAQPPL